MWTRRSKHVCRWLSSVCGVLFFTVIGRVLRSVPSFSAVATCGVYLIVAGLCLLCWKAWRGGRGASFFPLADTRGGIMPFITTATHGFYGVWRGSGGHGLLLCFQVFSTSMAGRGGDAWGFSSSAFPWELLIFASALKFGTRSGAGKVTRKELIELERFLPISNSLIFITRSI